MRHASRTALPLLIALLVPVTFAVRTGVAARPRLVLQITVDQLRGDMVTRYADRWGDGGFRRLLDEGTHFANVHYDHSTTFTAVGHATLFTGGGPAQHGIAGNDWFDAATRKRVYSVEDARYVILGAKAAKPNEGTGPRNLTSTTIGDEMIAASAGSAKVFSVSIKDRGAVIPGGRRGKAFWYDKDTGRFVTSNYNYADYPQWVRSFNDAARPCPRLHAHRPAGRPRGAGPGRPRCGRGFSPAAVGERDGGGGAVLVPV